MIEHFHALAILHHSGFFVHLRHVVAQKGLHSGNVGDFEHPSAPAMARSENCRHRQAGHDQDPSKKYCG
jgi:hypothetical protein